MDTFDTFNEIYTMLETVPGLSTAIGMEQAMRFVRLQPGSKTRFCQLGMISCKWF
jgi:hypothetical protein